MKKKIKFLSIISILVCIFCISGCQSTEKSNSIFNYSNLLLSKENGNEHITYEICG